MTERDRAKKIILEIIRQSGGVFSKRTNLYKAFYLAHLYYCAKESRILSTWPVVHMPRGPGIDDGECLIDELVQGGDIQIRRQQIGPYFCEVFSLTRELDDAFEAEEVAAIKSAVDFVANRGATELSDIMHDFSKSWNMHKAGKALNLYIDMIPDDEYERMEMRQAEIGNLIEETFG